MAVANSSEVSPACPGHPVVPLLALFVGDLRDRTMGTSTNEKTLHPKPKTRNNIPKASTLTLPRSIRSPAQAPRMHPRSFPILAQGVPKKG